MLQLWVHESLRVFGDRMWDSQDLVLLDSAINERLTVNFSTSREELFAGRTACPPFASFLQAGSGRCVPACDRHASAQGGCASVRVRGLGTCAWLRAERLGPVQEFLEQRLDAYGANGNGNPPLDIVLFRRVCLDIKTSQIPWNLDSDAQTPAKAGAMLDALDQHRDALHHVCRMHRVLLQPGEPRATRRPCRERAMQARWGQCRCGQYIVHAASTHLC